MIDSLGMMGPWPEPGGAEESIDFDQVLFDLREGIPATVPAHELKRGWFKHFDSPTLHRLGLLFSREGLGRHIVLSRCGRGRAEQLQVEIPFGTNEHMIASVSAAGVVRIWFEPSTGRTWQGELDRSGEAGLARFIGEVRRLAAHLDRCGSQGAAGVLRAFSFTPCCGSSAARQNPAR